MSRKVYRTLNLNLCIRVDGFYLWLCSLSNDKWLNGGNIQFTVEVCCTYNKKMLFFLLTSRSSMSEDSVILFFHIVFEHVKKNTSKTTYYSLLNSIRVNTTTANPTSSSLFSMLSYPNHTGHCRCHTSHSRWF